MSATGRRRILRVPLAAVAASALTPLAERAARAADLPAIVAVSKPSVVAIGLHAPLQSPKFRFVGSGFAVGNGRQVVTCAHVIPTVDPERRESVAVAVPADDGARVYKAKPAAIDKDTDLAVLEIDGPALPALALADPSTIRQGADVVLLGMPMGGALGLFIAAHRGILAAITPLITPAPSAAGLRAPKVEVMRGDPLQLLQLDATVFPGSSGGPLIDVASGRVIGVVSLGLAKRTKESAIQYPTGISYAVPVQYLAPLLEPR